MFVCIIWSLIGDLQYVFMYGETYICNVISEEKSQVLFYSVCRDLCFILSQEIKFFLSSGSILFIIFGNIFCLCIKLVKSME